MRPDKNRGSRSRHAGRTGVRFPPQAPETTSRLAARAPGFPPVRARWNVPHFRHVPALVRGTRSTRHTSSSPPTRLLLSSILWILTGCSGGVSPDDIVGTWVYDEGTTVTLACGQEGVDGTYSLAGQTFTFHDGKGTPYDLVYSDLAPGCDLGFDLEGNDIVLKTTMMEGCYPDDPVAAASLSQDLRMTYDDGKILLSGDYTVDISTPTDPEEMTCDVSLEGSMSKADAS